MLIIRAISPSDRESVVEIARNLPQWFLKPALEEIAHAAETERGHVALQDERCAGFATYLPRENKCAELTWIGVDPSRHRTGIGRKLLEAIDLDLTVKGYECLEVSTVADTEDYEPYARTRSFYSAIGFRDVSIKQKGFPSRDDRLLMRKQLKRGESNSSHSTCPQS
jgi:ribosomal protein S18 acetylase RimI-like enzyme